MLSVVVSYNLTLAQSDYYNVRDYGSTGARSEDATSSIQKAIDQCAKGGGGTVYIPPGDYSIGPIFIKNNVTLDVRAGATLWCTEDLGKFYKSGRLPTSSEISEWKGLHTDYQMINGEDLKNATITGKGAIHGQGEKLWWGKHKIRPYVIRIKGGEDVTFSDLTVKECPFHSFNFTDITNLIVKGVVLRNDPKSPNTDGLHIGGCKNVKVLEVDFSTGDDCLLTPGSEDVLVANSHFKTPWGVWWPSRTTKRFTMTNCIVDCQMLVKDFRNAEDVVISNIVATGPGRLFSSYGGQLKNVLISNVIATDWAQGGWFVNGENITLDNVQIHRREGSGNQFLLNGFDFKQVNGLTLRNVGIYNVEDGPALYCEDVTDLVLDGFESSAVPVDQAVVQLKNVVGANFYDNAGEQKQTWAAVTGKSSGIHYGDNHWNGATIEIEPGMGRGVANAIMARIESAQIPDKLKPNKESKGILTISSLSEKPGLYPVEMHLDDTVIATQWFWLQPNETREVNFTIPKLYASGTHQVAFNEAQKSTLKVASSPAALELIEVELVQENRVVMLGEEVSLKAMVKNAGTKAGELNIDLKANGRTVATRRATFEPGENQEIAFSFQPEEGLQELSIANQWSANIKVYSEPLKSEFLFYSFDEADFSDDSGLGYTGTSRANPDGTTPQAIDGIKGKAQQFNGNSAYAEIPAMLFRFPMTISLWIKPGSLTESSTAGRQMILYASEPTGNDGYGPEPEIHLMRAPGNTIVFWSNVGKRVDLRYPFEGENEWLHVAIVYDETSKMYFNGELVSSFSGFEAQDFSSFVNRIYIGRPNVDYLRYFNGAIDELYFFNEALSEEEVRRLYKNK